MSLFTYQPDQMQISLGIPGLDLAGLGFPNIAAHVTVKDWVSLTSQKNSSRFAMSRGVLGEPFLEYSSDTSRIFSLSILQTSDDVVQLRDLFLIQTFGILGIPFSVSDLSGGSLTDEILTGLDLNTRRQKSAYAVAVILDEPSESWTLEGAAWVFQIAVTYGHTLYI